MENVEIKTAINNLFLALQMKTNTRLKLKTKFTKDASFEQLLWKHLKRSITLPCRCVRKRQMRRRTLSTIET